jgi:hypothetical protein
MKVIKLYRIEIQGYFKVALKVFDKEISDNPISITILEDVPKGLEIGKEIIINYK